MKAILAAKIVQNGIIANELLRSEAYRAVLEKQREKEEQVRKDALSSKTIEDLRYWKGFLDGLDFFEATVDQMSQRAETLKKKH